MEKDSVEFLKTRIDLYERDGAKKLFFSLNRKANEMANLLNKTDLTTLSLDDKNDKTFERLKILWNDAATISTAIKSLGDVVGVAANEKDEDKKISRNLTPENISDVLGNTAGQHS